MLSHCLIYTIPQVLGGKWSNDAIKDLRIMTKGAHYDAISALEHFIVVAARLVFIKIDFLSELSAIY